MLALISKIGLLATLSLGFISCQTTEKEPLKLLSFSEVNPFDIDEFEFRKNDEVVLNATILKKELKSGVRINLNTVHSAEGVLQCYFDGVGKTCYVRPKLPDSPYYGPKTPVPSSLANRLADYFQKSRQDLLRDRSISASFGCDYVSKKMVKEKAESDLRCYLLHPRRTSEEVLTSSIAGELYKNLGMALNKENISTDLLNDTKVDGFLVCDNLIDAKNSTCEVLTKTGFEAKNQLSDIENKSTKKRSKNKDKTPARQLINKKILPDLKRKLFTRYGEYRVSTQQKRSSNYKDPKKMTVRFSCQKHQKRPACILFL